jgi:hypothetical protein
VIFIIDGFLTLYTKDCPIYIIHQKCSGIAGNYTDFIINFKRLFLCCIERRGLENNLTFSWPRLQLLFKQVGLIFAAAAFSYKKIAL